MRVSAALVEREPAMRPLLTPLPAAFRLLIERGPLGYEAELGLSPTRDPQPATPVRKSTPPRPLAAAPKRR
jgi:hypothetical protein